MNKNYEDDAHIESAYSEDNDEMPEVEIILKNVIHNDSSLFILADADGHLMKIMMTKDKDEKYRENAVDYLVQKHSLFFVLAMELVNQWLHEEYSKKLAHL